MKYLLLFAFCSCIFFSLNAQIVLQPLKYDANRSASEQSLSNARVAAIEDTLQLPFFEDFSSPNASIDSIYFRNEVIEIHTLGPHGLQNGTTIFLSFREPEAGFLNGNRFIKVLSQTSFGLFTDAALLNALQYTSTPNFRLHGYWRRPGAQLGPNPDSLKWQPGGGTFINKTLSLNPPSIYVASFDGLKGNGSPYGTNENRGFTDNLTTRPINLNGLDASSKVQLTFYYQLGGLGSYPDRRDSLFLQFKDAQGIWKWIWGLKGGGFTYDSSQFYNVSLPITDPTFFHGGFQFRFQCFGSVGSASENWNIDYIYLDKNWNEQKQKPRDRAISNSQTSILKNFSSMPYDQFIVNKNNELADTVSFTLRSLSDEETLLQFENNYVYTNPRDTVPFEVPVAQPLITPGITRGFKWQINKNAFNFSGSDFTVKYVVSAFTSDPDKLNGIDFTTNNTDTSYTHFGDYFAYDDGSAEVTASNIRGGPLVIEYKLNRYPDTLTHIDINLPKNYFFNDTYHRQIVLLAGENKDKLQRITLIPDYSLAINNFNRIALNSTNSSGIPITGPTFYVGYENPQPDGQNQFVNIPIGYDLNTPSRGTVYFKRYLFNPWEKYIGKGNFLIRPVFGSIAVAGVVDKHNILNCDIFPNPSSGEVTIQGDINLGQIYDLTGRLIETFNFGHSSFKQINLSQIQNGIYYLHLENLAGLKSVKKLILSK